MQVREFVVGFLELKDLLIQSYGIEKDRTLIKLHFTSDKNELLMHDYDDHKKTVTLSWDVVEKKLIPQLKGKAMLVAQEALKHKSPAHFLNATFKLYGFFKF